MPKPLKEKHENLHFRLWEIRIDIHPLAKSTMHDLYYTESEPEYISEEHAKRRWQAINHKKNNEKKYHGAFLQAKMYNPTSIWSFVLKRDGISESAIFSLGAHFESLVYLDATHLCACACAQTGYSDAWSRKSNLHIWTPWPCSNARVPCAFADTPCVWTPSGIRDTPPRAPRHLRCSFRCRSDCRSGSWTSAPARVGPQTGSAEASASLERGAMLLVRIGRDSAPGEGSVLWRRPPFPEGGPAEGVGDLGTFPRLPGPGWDCSRSSRRKGSPGEPPAWTGSLRWWTCRELCEIRCLWTPSGSQSPGGHLCVVSCSGQRPVALLSCSRQFLCWCRPGSPQPVASGTKRGPQRK